MQFVKVRLCVSDFEAVAQRCTVAYSYRFNAGRRARTSGRLGFGVGNRRFLFFFFVLSGGQSPINCARRARDERRVTRVRRPGVDPDWTLDPVFAGVQFACSLSPSLLIKPWPVVRSIGDRLIDVVIRREPGQWRIVRTAINLFFPGSGSTLPTPGAPASCNPGSSPAFLTLDPGI